MATSLLTTCSALSGGQDGVAGASQTIRFTFSGAWLLGDKYTINFIFAGTGVGERFGAGDLTGKQISALYTYKNKMNLVAGDEWFFSQIGDSTAFNDPEGAGNGVIKITNHLGTSENLVGLCLYKNKMLLLSANNAQIWDIGPDPENYVQAQVLQSIGASASLSVKGLGQLDVLLLGNAGVHNIQAKSDTLDAGVIDIGTPVNAMIAEAIDGGASETSPCAIVEPKASRYWVLVDGTFYVMSYYAQAGVVSWSTFEPNVVSEVGVRGRTFSGLGVLAFVPVANAIYYYDKGNSTAVSFGAGGSFVSAYITNSNQTSGTVAGPAGQAFTGAVYRVDSFTSVTPEKLVVQSGVVYFRATNNKVYAYGSSTGKLYDCTQAILELPWLADKTPMTRKQFLSLDLAMRGGWVITGGSDPTSGTLSAVWTGGSNTSPNMNVDSTFDSLGIPLELQGTHLKLRCSSSSSNFQMCRVGGIHILYNSLDTN